MRGSCLTIINLLLIATFRQLRAVKLSWFTIGTVLVSDWCISDFTDGGFRSSIVRQSLMGTTPTAVCCGTDSMLCCMIVGVKVLGSKFHCPYWPSPAGHSSGTKPPSVERDKTHKGNYHFD